MGTKTSSVHPLSGMNQTSAGATQTIISGTNIAYGKQLFPDSVDRKVDFTSIFVPSDIDVTGNVQITLKFKQDSAGSGNVFLDLLWNAISGTTDRDASALTSTTATANAVPGTLNQEFTKTVNVSAATLVAGQEFLFAVQRQGSSGSDTFSGDISLVACDVAMPQVVSASTVWSTGSGYHYLSTLANKILISPASTPAPTRKLEVRDSAVQVAKFTSSDGSNVATIEISNNAPHISEIRANIEDVDIRPKGEESLICKYTASAVNAVSVKGSATGDSVTISAEGADTDIDVSLKGQNNAVVMVDDGFGMQGIKHTVAGPTTMQRENSLHVCDTSANAVQIDLPDIAGANIPDGYTVFVKDVGGNAGTNNITIGRDGGENIDGAASNWTISTNYGMARFLAWEGAWYIIGNL